MPGATPIYSLPYPVTGDTLAAAVSTIPHDLATHLESTLQAFGGIANPGAWTNLTLLGATSAFGAGWQTPQYSKAGVWVELRGLIKATAALTAPFTLCNLPVGFRPLSTGGDRRFPADTSFKIDVKVNGDVVLSTSATIGAGISLDAIRFRVD